MGVSRNGTTEASGNRVVPLRMLETTMQRRKFLAGVGAGAVGGSALIGSGAFTRVESQRRTKIKVAKDPHAYLGLQGCPDSPNNSYTNIDEKGHLEVDMSPANPTAEGGQGINSDSFTYFDSVFQICNQGKQPVAIWIDATVNPKLPDPEEPYDDEPRVTFYVEDDDERLINEANPELLQPGDCLCVGIRTMTKGLEKGDQLLEDDEIVINADADVAADPPQGGSVWNQTQGTTYSTIQAANDDANEGDVIKVFPTNNSYEEMVEIDVDNLTVHGIDWPVIRAPTGITGGTPNVEVMESASGVTIQGLDVDTRGVGGSVPGGIHMNGDDGIAYNNRVRYSDPGANGQGFVAGGGNSLTFEDNVLDDTAMAYWGSGSAELYGNEFVGPKIDEALWSTTDDELTVEDNVFTDADPDNNNTGSAMVKFTQSGVTVNGETGATDITNRICLDNVDPVNVEVAGVVNSCNSNA